jgi:hypothetical protein
VDSRSRRETKREVEQARAVQRRGQVATRIVASSRQGAKGRVDVSLVIPSFNEALRMEESFPRLLEVLEDGAVGLSVETTEVIVVDDGSTDGTAEAASRHLSHLPHFEILRQEANQGKGAAVRTGVTRSRGAMVAFVDADMATDPADLPALIGALKDHEVVIGSRVLPESVVNCRDPKRVLFGRAFNRFVRFSTGMSHPDTQCGFKAFRAPAGKLLFHASTIDRFAFDVEILMIAHKLGMRVGEVPVTWTDMKGSHVRPMLDALPMLADVVRSVATWRKMPPVEAVAVVAVGGGRGDGGNGDGSSMPLVGSVLRSSVRHSDPVVVWPHGALALLPCRDPVAAAAVRARLAQRLPGCRVEKSTVTIDMLMHPSAMPLMRALCSLPGRDGEPQGISCDEPEARRLLETIRVG